VNETPREAGRAPDGRTGGPGRPEDDAPRGVPEAPSAPPGPPEASPARPEDPLAGFVPPDPDEPPPLELGRAVGDVRPWGSVVLLLAWGLVFAWFSARGVVGQGAALFAWGADAAGRPALETAWRVIACTFLHAGALHVLLNAVSLLMFGPAVEAVFSRAGFWTVYVGGGATASLASLAWRVWRHAEAGLSVGASGAVFALGGAMIAAAIRLRGRLAVGRARALGASALFLVAQALASGFQEMGTDNAAHAGGLATGVMLGLLAPLSERLEGRRPGWPGRTVGVLAAAALVAAFVVSVISGLRAGF